jgi:hypothetical protein
METNANTNGSQTKTFKLAKANNNRQETSKKQGDDDDPLSAPRGGSNPVPVVER